MVWGGGECGEDERRSRVEKRTVELDGLLCDDQVGDRRESRSEITAVFVSQAGVVKKTGALVRQ